MNMLMSHPSSLESLSFHSLVVPIVVRGDDIFVLVLEAGASLARSEHDIGVLTIRLIRCRVRCWRVLNLDIVSCHKVIRNNWVSFKIA